jgi:hypothetical protein
MRDPGFLLVLSQILRNNRIRIFRTPLAIPPIGLILIPVHPLVQRHRLFNLLKRLDRTERLRRIGHARIRRIQVTLDILGSLDGNPCGHSWESFHDFNRAASFVRAAACNWLIRDSVMSIIDAICFMVRSRV